MKSTANLAKADAKEWPAALAFCVTPLLAGAAAAKVGLGLRPVNTPWHYPAHWPPLTMFWLVWTVIYPSWGYGAYLLWQKRNRADVRGAIAMTLTTMVGGLFFMPTAALTGNNPIVMTLGDANGVLSSWILAWLYSRYDSRSTWFLAPLLVWMPITLGLKIWYSISSL
jgi:tryptophan-rich sensory protein